MYLYAAYLHPIKFWPLNLFYIEILRHAVCVWHIHTLRYAWIITHTKIDSRGYLERRLGVQRFDVGKLIFTFVIFEF